MLLLKSVFPHGNLSYWSDISRSSKLWFDCPLFARPLPLSSQSLAKLIDSVLEGLPPQRVFCWVADYANYSHIEKQTLTEIWEGERYIVFSGGQQLHSLCMFRRGIVGISTRYSIHLYKLNQTVFYEDLPRSFREKLDRVTLDFEFFDIANIDEATSYRAITN